MLCPFLLISLCFVLSGCSSEDVPLALQWLDIMISRRKKQVRNIHLYCILILPELGNDHTYKGI